MFSPSQIYLCDEFHNKLFNNVTNIFETVIINPGNNPYTNCFVRVIPEILTLTRCTKPRKLGFVLYGFGLIFSGITLTNS